MEAKIANISKEFVFYNALEVCRSNIFQDNCYVLINGIIFYVFVNDSLDRTNDIYFGTSNVHRKSMKVKVGDKVKFEIVKMEEKCQLSKIVIELIPWKDEDYMKIDSIKLINLLKDMHRPVSRNSELLLQYEDEQGKEVYNCKIRSILPYDRTYGTFDNEETEIELVSKSENLVIVKGIDTQRLNDLNKTLDSLGIGGMREQFGLFVRRVVRSRTFKKDTLDKFNINHVKGVILYGPPGTGKTLLARQIGKLVGIDKDNIKIVNGPELLNKYVGESEDNMRKLFIPAERNPGKLYMIIFDEIDSLCRQRSGGSNAGSNTGDNLVNQLLTKMDGIESINNIIIIGTTNRIDLIDEALLRPGRFEIQIETSLPNEEERYEIFKVHTDKMKENGKLDTSVNIKNYAKRCVNYTGAEITAVINSAFSFALERFSFDTSPNKDESQVKISNEDFDFAIKEIKPRYGYNSDELSKIIPESYIPSDDHKIMISQCKHKIYGIISDMIDKDEIEYSTLKTYMFESKDKSKLYNAIMIALACGVEYIKVINPSNMLDKTQSQKCSYLIKEFSVATECKNSIIILNNVESIVEYVSHGGRVNYELLQTLVGLLDNKPKKKNHKLFVFMTTSNRDLLESFEIKDYNIIQSED